MGRKSKLVWNWISEGQMWPLPGYQAFWLPPSLPVPCSSLYRKHGGGKTGRVGREVERREEVGGGNVFEWEAYAVKLCTTPCGAGCVEGKSFFLLRNIPPCELRYLICSLRPLPFFSLTNSFSFSFILFNSITIWKLNLNSEWPTEEVSLVVLILDIRYFVIDSLVLHGGFFFGRSNNQTVEMYNFKALQFW